MALPGADVLLALHLRHRALTATFATGQSLVQRQFTRTAANRPSPLLRFVVPPRSPFFSCVTTGVHAN